MGWRLAADRSDGASSVAIQPLVRRQCTDDPSSALRNTINFIEKAMIDHFCHSHPARDNLKACVRVEISLPSCQIHHAKSLHPYLTRNK